VVRGIPDNKLAGLVIYPRRTIWIDGKLSIHEMESTLLHELIHVIAHHLDFGLSEKKVLALEKGLYALFRRNKWKITI
jgi:predicted Zn-dependent protease with MMP-like domain